MLKIFTLVAVAAIAPLSKNISTLEPVNRNEQPESVFRLHLKSTDARKFWEPEKKTTEPWSQNWMAGAQENIRKSEYHFKWEEKYKTYCTPNRKNNLRFFYNDKGFIVEPRTTKIPVGEHDPLQRPDETKYKNIPGWKIKFNLDKKQVGTGVWKVADNKAEYITNKITVQYINNEEGMRQNFIVHTPLSKSNTLKINFSVKTKLKSYLQGSRLRFFYKKTNVLNYEQLKVWDADGMPLQASIQKKNKNKFYIAVDTKNASYPITIDPISVVPDWITESNEANANYGNSVASAGDVNGDGYSDVIVGAQNHPGAGRAYIYYGSAIGLSTAANVVLTTPEQGGTRFGSSVSTAGDVNGDGFSDIIVGAAAYFNGQVGEGRAYVYHGSATGLNTVAAWITESNSTNANYGSAVSTAGDVNGDGYSDVIVGAHNYTVSISAEGRAYVYLGSAAGLSTTAVWTGQSNQPNSFYGNSVSGAGDVNGDGYSDIIIGNYYYTNGLTNEGRAFVYHGNATGVNTAPDWEVESNSLAAHFGNDVSTAGDVNGDGYSDVIIGADTYDNVENNEGAAYIFLGSPTGLSTSAAWLKESNQTGAFFGTSVACAGDVNGDGFSDVMVGSFFYTNGQVREGAAFVYLGSAAGPATIHVWTGESNQAEARYGLSVASAGDVNGDGYSDVIAGAYLYSNGQASEGAAYQYYGAPAGLSATPNSTPDDADLADVNFAYSVASAGDVNADGYSDVIIGAPQYDESANANVGRVFVYHGSATGLSATPNSILDETDQALAYFGWSVATAGDVNGDGYSDVVIGASQYDDGGNTNEGRAFLYHGSSTGLSLTANSTPDDANQAGAHFGISVASAGDVNGDGYSDVIIGAYLFDDTFSDEGVAYVYHGSATGLSLTPSSMPDDADQLSANFGFSVSTAGDVNGDGFGDVIIGASSYDDVFANEGRAFVYYGSAAGVSVMPTGVMDNADQLNASFGFSVASAGDVNGDGYSDVIIGAYQYDDAFVNEGRAYIYHGSASGLSGIPNSVPEDADQANAFFGVSVAGAGDINGDGYSDVIIGAYGYTDMGNVGEGRAFVYHGNDSVSNKRNNLRLYNTDLTTPINSNNFIFGNFGAGLFAKSFLGKVKGKLVWETRINYNAYSGNPITNSTLFTAQQAVYSDLGLAGMELKDVITKLLGSGIYTKLRARVKYDPVTAITGQVYGPWRNVSSVIDGNSLGALPIELVSFKATWLQKGRSAKLDFTTDKENGICCFTIEKSLDGFNFYPIGSMPAKNTTGLQSYSFIDYAATNKKQFYRLIIKGINGKIENSNIQQLQNDKATEIFVFPNPTTDVLQLQLNKVYAKMNVQIVSSVGQLVKQLVIPVSNQIITIPVQNLARGKYWLYLQSGDEKQVLQFIKQ